MRKETLEEVNNMSWFQIIKSRWELEASENDERRVGESRLKESRIWEDMENPEEMKNFILNEQISDRIQWGEGNRSIDRYSDLIHLELKDKTYVGFDKFITDFKKLLGPTWKYQGRDREEKGISNQIYWAIIEITNAVTQSRIDYKRKHTDSKSHDKDKNKEIIRMKLLEIIKEHCNHHFYNKIRSTVYPYQKLFW